MTTPSTAVVAAPESPARHRTRRILTTAATISGAAFLIDTLTVTVINHSFGALDDGLFLTGLVTMAITLVALSVQFSARTTGIARLGLGVVAFVIAFTVLGVVAGLMDQFGRHVFATADVGLHGEWSFFTVGLVMLAIAVRSARRIR